VTDDNIDRWEDAAAIERELAAAEGKTDAEYFEPYMRRQVGDRLYQRYYRNYTEKHWGIDPARITGDWFDFKISFPDTEDSFFSGEATYPDRKYTEILREMVADCDLVFEGATGVVTDGDRVTGVETENGVVDGDLFVSTIDPTFLVDHDEDLEYRSMVILGAHVEASERLFPDHVSWGYFPNDYEFTRITDYDFTPQSIPDGEYILTVEFPCFVGDQLWSRPDEWYVEYLVPFLEDQGIEVTVRESEVRRAARAYPLPVESEIATFREVNSRLDGYENLYNLGRVSTYEYIWIKDIVQQAHGTVEEMLAAESET
jgi:UDP-galactopyranose mutase